MVADGIAISPAAPHRQWYLQLVLDRLLHDFSNAVGGILALTEHHLHEGGLDASLRTSLELMRDGAVHCREMLVDAGSLSGEDEPSFLRPTDLCEEVAATLRAFLPRPVLLEVAAPSVDGVVWAAVAEWKRRWLAVAGLSLSGVPPSAIRFELALVDDHCRFTFEPADGAPAGTPALLLAMLAPELDPTATARVSMRPTAGAWAVEVDLPLVADAALQVGAAHSSGPESFPFP